MGRPCSPRELVVSTFPFFKSVLLLLLLLLLHRTPNDVSGRFETTGAFPSMFFTCPNFFSKHFSFSLPENRQLRPAQKRPYQRVFEFFLRDDVECSQISALVKKKTKNSMKFWSKNSPQSRKNQ
jgi:hypothetical protein